MLIVACQFIDSNIVLHKNKQRVCDFTAQEKDISAAIAAPGPGHQYPNG
jgi:hypothetical protein